MMTDDTFDNPLLGGQEPPKLPSLRSFKIVRPGREDVLVEAHATETGGTSIAFFVIELVNGQPIPRMRHFIIALELEVIELVEFNTDSRIIQ